MRDSQLTELTSSGLDTNQNLTIILPGIVTPNNERRRITLANFLEYTFQSNRTRRVVFSRHTPQSITGVTVETTFTNFNFTITPDLVRVNSNIWIEAMFSFTNTANAKNPRIRVGGTSITTAALASQTGWWLIKPIRVRSLTAMYTSPANAAGPIQAAGVEYPIDFTQNQTVTFTATPASAADTVSLESVTIEIAY